MFAIDHDGGLPLVGIFPKSDPFVPARVGFLRSTVTHVLTLSSGAKILNSIVDRVAVSVINVIRDVSVMHQENYLMEIHCFSVDANFFIWPSVTNGLPSSNRTLEFVCAIFQTVQVTVLISEIFFDVIKHVEPFVRTM